MGLLFGLLSIPSTARTRALYLCVTGLTLAYAWMMGGCMLLNMYSTTNNAVHYPVAYVHVRHCGSVDTIKEYVLAVAKACSD